MKKYIVYAILILLTGIKIAYAQSTTRTEQFSNDKVNIWKTIIYPTSNQILTMHRHDSDRVLVALSDGTLKITNNKGDVHELILTKNKAYYLSKDPTDELHQDENISKQPITVMVIELII
jgi:beta-alanine degradation protein BauB